MREAEQQWERPASRVAEVIAPARTQGDAWAPPSPVRMAPLAAPGAALAAPSSGRLRQLPPPPAIEDAVPLELDQLEHVTQRLRERRPAFTYAVPVTTAGDLVDIANALAAAPAPVTAPDQLADALPSTAQLLTPVDDAAPLVDAPAPAPHPTLAPPSLGARAASPLLTPAPTPTATEAPDPAATPPAGRSRRAGVLVGSVAVFALASLAAAALAQQRRDGSAEPVTAVVTTVAPAPATSAVAPTSAATTAATVAATTATTAPAPTTAAPISVPPTTPPTEAPTTVPDTTTAATPAPTTAPPASVLGTTVLNRELLDALGTASLPGGQPWPLVTFNDGRLTLTGAVPDRATADAMVRTAASLATIDVVDDRLTLDPSVPAVRYLLVRLFDSPVFDRGSTRIRADAVPMFELWGKRLRDQPGSTVVLIAHGDGTSTALSATRAAVARDRLAAAEGVTRSQIDAQWSAGNAAGPRLDFAIPVG